MTIVAESMVTEVVAFPAGLLSRVTSFIKRIEGQKHRASFSLGPTHRQCCVQKSLAPVAFPGTTIFPTVTALASSPEATLLGWGHQRPRWSCLLRPSQKFRKHE